VTLAVNHLCPVVGFGGAIAKGALKCLPPLLVDFLVLRSPQGMIAANGENIGHLQLI
jgi:hypothetical protein